MTDSSRWDSPLLMLVNSFLSVLTLSIILTFSSGKRLALLILGISFLFNSITVLSCLMYRAWPLFNI